MASNLIENIRSLHSEINLDKKAISGEILKPEERHKRKILQSHKIKARLERISKNSDTLFKIYNDQTGALAESELKISGKNSLMAFYSQLNEILSSKKELAEKRLNHEYQSELLNIKANFSGEEFYGKYIEMNAQYQTFLNLRGMPNMYLSGVKKIDYKLFLEVFDHFHHIPSLAKRSPSYRRYSNSLLLYLSDFYSRRYPLHPTSAILKDIRTEFEDRWRKGDVPGWQKPWPLEVFHQLPAKCSLPLDMRADEKWKIDREDKLKPDGDEKAKVNGIVKNDKERLSVFCESCKKRFKKTVWRSHISGRKHKKNVQRKLREKDTNKKNSNSEADGDPTNTNSNKNVLEGKEKETAYVEFAVRVLKTLLSEVFEGTCSYIEKKLTRSYEEVRKELEEREKEEEEDVEKQDEEDLYSGGVYNPKKIPLGWDGRPIPYWLFKFHGLNIGHKCEICGGTKYYGPRAFQQHFKEWKHANGMKALGIPNTKHFHNITKIKEAETLYQKLKEKKLVEMFNPDLEEEFEDQEGNVYGKKTYEALKRQRVI